MPNNLTILISIYAIDALLLCYCWCAVSFVWLYSVKKCCNVDRQKKAIYTTVFDIFGMIVSPCRVVWGQLRVILCVRFDEFFLILLHAQHLFVFAIVLLGGGNPPKTISDPRYIRTRSS